jgi:hypothetical protein
MWVKTVLKQHAKLLPKNETINQAIAIDNNDSRISDIKEKLQNGELTMGGYLEKNHNEKTNQKESGDKEGVDDEGFTEDSINIGK